MGVAVRLDPAKLLSSPSEDSIRRGAPCGGGGEEEEEEGGGWRDPGEAWKPNSATIASCASSTSDRSRKGKEMTRGVVKGGASPMVT